MRILLIPKILLIMAVLVSCQQRSSEIKFQTIALEGFEKHPKGTAENDGFSYKINFQYPSKYADQAVLEKLQAQFARYTLGEDYAQSVSVTELKKAVDAYLAVLKKMYHHDMEEMQNLNSDPDFVIGWHVECSNAILFMNDALLQLQTKDGLYPYGAHVFENISYHLFDLRTGDEYSRDDIFKPENAENISRLIIPELLKFWNVRTERELRLQRNKVWRQETNFAITDEGVLIAYNDYELTDNMPGMPYLTIPYEKIMPYLREGTPVWDAVGATASVAPDQEEATFEVDHNIQTIALTLAAQVPEINEHYDYDFSGDENDEWDLYEKQYLYRYTKQANDAERRKLQLYWYERAEAAIDWVMVSYVDGTTQGYHPWLKCFTFDRKTGALNEAELPFAIPSAYEFDNNEFTADHAYWRTGYTILMDGSIVILASPSMNATCVMLARWDEKGDFQLFKRGISLSNSEPVEDNADAEQYVQNVILPNVQRIEAIENWTWTEEKDVWDISLEGTQLTYYYSSGGLEKIIASLAGEYYSATITYYFLNRYLSFVVSETNKYPENLYSDDFNPDEAVYTLIKRKWFMKDGFCFRGVGNNGEILSLADEDSESNMKYETQQLFDVIMGK